MKAKALIKDLLPPLLLNALRYLYPASSYNAIRFTGNYQSWEEAERCSDGYGTHEIVERTRAAALAVRNGVAAFERDAVTFDAMEYRFPLLAGLLQAANADGGYLNVLDFGGSLGSTYFQCRTFLSAIKELRWSVVEQRAHVVCGRQEFANEQLHFYETVDECLADEHPNVLLLSGVVQCLRQPYELLRDLLRYRFPFIIVDRTAFASDGRDRLTVEHVPAWIYSASYPSWFLSEKRFLAEFDEGYQLVADFSALDTLEPEGGKAAYKGFIFELKKSQ
jgi:putative methyltransferase (TIGR04325 family)